MPSLPSVVVDVCRPAPDRLPDQLVESALRLGRLQRRGFFVEVGQRLRLQRKAGSYVGIDLVAFLVAYHASGVMCGLKEFADRLRGHGRRMASLAGRVRWPGALAGHLLDLPARPLRAGRHPRRPGRRRAWTRPGQALAAGASPARRARGGGRACGHRLAGTPLPAAGLAVGRRQLRPAMPGRRGAACRVGPQAPRPTIPRWTSRPAPRTACHVQSDRCACRAPHRPEARA